MPAPERIAQADQFHGLCVQMLDTYVEAVEDDMNRYADKNPGAPMDTTKAHNDITLMLARDLGPGVLAGIMAEALLREIGRKLKGKGRK